MLSRSNGTNKFYESLRKHWVTILMVVVVDIVAAANNVSFKLSADALHNYPYFMSLISLSVYVVVFGVMFLVQHYVFHSIEPQVFKFPLRNYFYLSILLAAAHVQLYASAPHVPGPTTNLLQQSVMVMQFGLSIIFFKRKYSISHFLSVMLVLAGIVVFFIPSFIHTSDSNPNDSAAKLFFWEMMIMGWCLLWALNNCAFEKILNDQCSSTAWLNIWVSMFCIPVDAGMAYVILLFEKENFLDHIYHGGQCLFLGHTGIPSDSTCVDALWLWILYSALSMVVSLLSLLLIKRLGAAVSALVSAIVLPLTNLIFTSPLLGAEAVPFDIFSVLSMIVITLGMFAYGSADYLAEKKKNSNNKEEEVKKGSHSYIKINVEAEKDKEKLQKEGEMESMVAYVSCGASPALVAVKKDENEENKALLTTLEASLKL